MLLSVEYQADREELDIICDRAGIDLLVSKLSVLKHNGGHTHLRTPSWAGEELTEERYTESGVLINHVRIVLMSEKADLQSSS